MPNPWENPGVRRTSPHGHQVKSKSKRHTSLSNSNVPGLARLFRRQVLAIARHMSFRVRFNSANRVNPAAMRPMNERIASQALLRLFVGSPQTLAITSQCWINAPIKRDHTRTICRTAVEPRNTATRSCDFQRLKSNSICQRARYKTTASGGVIISTGTLVTKIVQSHHAKRAALGSWPRLLMVS